jgi:formylglycine-generating enzyme required for sulfatase activity
MNQSIFISYSSVDKAVADQICACLEASGIDCWIAPRDISPGADYPAAILQGLQQSRAVVLIVSPAAVESPHIMSEVGHAFSKKKPIIPFRIAVTTLPPDFDYFLSLSQWLDASGGCTQQNLARLKEAVLQAQSSPVPRASRAARKGYAAIAASGLLLLALAAVAWWRWPAAKPGLKEDHPVEAKLVASADDRTRELPPLEKTPAKPQPWVNPKDGLTYVQVPPGQFVMGCSAGDSECRPDESPSHMVEIPSAFWMSQTEVTNAAYQRLVPSAKFPAGEAKLPVVEVSWQQARSYCAAAGGRLPTEAEWEYAARAGSTSPYYGLLSKIAWYEANSGGMRHDVATKQPNAFGLYDTLGNASEWVADRYFDKYDPQAPANAQVQLPLAGNASALTRGGFWESPASGIRVSHRTPMDNQDPGPMAGIRCVVDHKPG